jgi:predicted nuclease of predicted toxin-antitoxin system
VKFQFFSDHCVPLSIARALQQHGHEVAALYEHLPVNSPDPVVIAKAQELDAVLLSLNGDFSDIVEAHRIRLRS